MKCKICGTKNARLFTGKILGKYEIDYFRCANCEFIQTQEPFWLDEAYKRPINLSDTGYMARNQFLAKRLSILLFLMYGKSGRYLDYAGGYGVFVRMMRDIGFDFYWDDLLTQNVFASGFENDGSMQFDALTSFEVFEHFVQPMAEIDKLLSLSNSIIFSTALLPNPVPKPLDWWYYGLEHGQHISFYSVSTFKRIAQLKDLNYCNLGSLHVLTRDDAPVWKLRISKGSALGMHKIIQYLMTSKTISDSQVMMTKQNENIF